MSIQMSGEQFQQLMQGIVQGRMQEGSMSDCVYRYNGTRNFHVIEDFLTNVSLFISSKHISEARAIEGFSLVLEGEAKTWWTGVRPHMQSWNQVKQTIRVVYQPPQPNWLLLNQISQEKQSESEPTDAYITRQLAMINRLINFPLQEPQQIDLMYGHIRLKIRKAVPRDSINTIGELLTKARVTELHEQEERLANPNQKDKKTCNYCNNHGHVEEDCRRKKRQEKPAERPNQKPRQPVNDNKNQQANKQPSNGNKPAFTCYGCGAPNVYRSKCTTCTKVAQPLRQHNEFYALHPQIGTDLPEVAVQFDNYNVLAYLDTCARVSVAGRELYHHLIEKGYNFEDIAVTMKLADGSKKLTLVSRTVAQIRIGGRIRPIQLIAIPGATGNSTILGADFIKQEGIIPNLIQDAWCFHDKPEEWFIFDYLQGEPNEITHTYDFQQIGQSIQKFSTRARSRSRKKGKTTPTKNYATHQQMTTVIASKPIEMDIEELKTQKSTDDYSKEQQALAILSKFTSPSFLPKMISPIGSTPKSKETDDTSIEYFQPELFNETTMEVDLCMLDLRPEEGENLSPQQRQRINQLIYEHRKIFNESGPPTDKAEHRIETGNHLPTATAPYRLSAVKREALQLEINKMLKEDIIEESESPWATNVVMKPKPNGKWRVCIDYRKLNEITISDKHPLPLIDDLLHDARGSLYMTTIDLQSGYWQIQVREEDREKTAIITPFGMYQFKRMPFGLKNAAATFQRMINKFKNELPQIKLLGYLDDLIIISNTFDQHVQDLQKVFQHLSKYKLRANRDKCNFACNEVKYLGHVITTKGIKMDPAKIEPIRARQPPQDIKQLLSFIQTCSWYRRFIKDFAAMVKPLTNLTKKNAKWEWTHVEQEAFNQLKIALCTTPILRQINPEKPFIIKSDASAYAIGAVLVQGESEEDEHPIEYASRLLNEAERNYSTIEREALAVVWATDKFRGYIEGGATIITDHQPLRWLMSIKSPSGRLARWALRLQQFDLTIKYQPGKTNVVADCLSRPPCNQIRLEEHTNNECLICSIQFDIPTKGAANIREQQLLDEELKKIITVFEESNKDEEFIRYTTRGYFMNNGILYRYNQSAEDESEDALLVIPKQDVQRILTEYHDLPTAGHYGVERTTARIASRYTWTGMRKQIADYVRKCKECQKYKVQNLKPAGIIQSTATHQRFETIAIDLFGPLPQSEEGYKHIFIVEDITSRWIELFNLKEATAEKCAELLLNEIFLRYGMPRRIISDNGTQFVSAVMQKLTYCLEINHTLLPVYHPQANPVERKNRDLKQQLAIQVGTNHTNWPTQVAAIRFAMNTAQSESTGYTPGYLTFGRNMRTRDDITTDLRAIVKNENFIPEITPKLLQLSETFQKVREQVEISQNRNQIQQDKSKRPDPDYKPGQRVLVKTHLLSKKDQDFTKKLAPRRDGPYIILQKVGAATYEIASVEDPEKIISTYYTSDITPYNEDNMEDQTKPIYPIRKRGRPKKQ